MSDKFLVYSRQIINNPLLGRKQATIEIVHPESGSISRTALREKIAAQYKVKVEQVAVWGLHSKFGGGRSTGFAAIYNSADDRKKFDHKKSLRRDGFISKPAVGRKQKKEIKGRVRKCRGKAKAAAVNAGAKKKK